MIDGRGRCAAADPCGLMGCRRCDAKRVELARQNPNKDWPPVDNVSGRRLSQVTAFRLLGVTLRKFQPGRAR